MNIWGHYTLYNGAVYSSILFHFKKFVKPYEDMCTYYVAIRSPEGSTNRACSGCSEIGGKYLAENMVIPSMFIQF